MTPDAPSLIFYRGPGTWMDRIIRIWTGGTFSHVELVLPPDSREPGDPRPKMVSASQSENCVRIRPAEIDPDHWETVDFPRSLDVERIWRFAAGQVGARYDWAGIFFSQVIPWGVENPRRWFCSEFVLTALIEGGFECGKRPAQVHPNMLYKLVTAERYAE